MKSMSSSGEELYEKLLASGLSAEQLEQEFDRKFKEYGGFMTKQGILFIIAKEHGINPYNDAFFKELNEIIDYDEFSITIAELKEQMTNIVLIGKIISITQPREFVRKDSSSGKVCSFVIGDWTGTVNVVLWEEQTSLVDSDFFVKGEIIRLIGGYSKLRTDNSLEVHLGKKGRIIIAPSDISQKVAIQLANMPEKEKPEQVQTPKFKIKNLIDKYSFIKRVQGEVQIEDFKELTKKDGEKTFILNLILSDESGSKRVNIWGMNAIEALKILDNGCLVQFTNLSVKENSYTKEKELFYTNKSSMQLI